MALTSYPGAGWTMYHDNVVLDMVDNVPSPGFAGHVPWHWHPTAGACCTITLYPGICWTMYYNIPSDVLGNVPSSGFAGLCTITFCFNVVTPGYIGQCTMIM